MLLNNLFSKLGAAAQTAGGQSAALQVFFASKSNRSPNWSGDFNQSFSRSTGSMFLTQTQNFFLVEYH
jgi:hypothetical protein